MNKAIVTESVITCPYCGAARLEPMPLDACQWSYDCKACGKTLKPRDGFRLMVRRDGDRVRLFTRNGDEWAARYPAIVVAAAVLPARSFLIDGEAVVADAQGVASVNLLRGRARETQAFVWAFGCRGRSVGNEALKRGWGL